ncbi:hypothetical protein JRQ81_001775, partial [Phrynocephalus forsythii]
HMTDYFPRRGLKKKLFPEADLYIMARVLHDYDDEKCVQLLTRPHKTCRPGGGVPVIEMVLREHRCVPLGRCYCVVIGRK